MSKLPIFTPDEQRIIETFNPFMRYVVRRKVFQELLLKYPRPAFYAGVSYGITGTHIGAGIYEVTGKIEIQKTGSGEKST